MAEPGPHPNDRAPIDRDSLRCSFCGKPATAVEDIICGQTPAIAICSECIDLCAEMLAEQRAGRRPG